MEIQELEEVINKLSKDLPQVSGKKMFGCHALWAKENVFALVWKEGRIGVKLPDESSYQKLLSVSGAKPWKAGAMQMAHWVLVPESFHQKNVELKKWLTLAHGQCIKLEKKKPTKKKVAKKVTKKIRIKK